MVMGSRKITQTAAWRMAGEGWKEDVWGGVAGHSSNHTVKGTNLIVANEVKTISGLGVFLLSSEG